VLKLSTAFKDITGLKNAESSILPLELTVQVYNINHGRNTHILSRSKTLDNYSFFISKVKEFNKFLSIEESVSNAVKYCIDHDVLKEFLKKHSPEIINMLTDDISIEEIAAIRYKEGREEGLEEGREEGQEKIVLNALAKGFSIEMIHELTGIEIKTIQELSKNR